MERIAVVVDRIQCLQRGADIVEVDLLRTGSGRMSVYGISVSRAVVTLVFILHGWSRSSGGTPDHRCSGSMPLLKRRKGWGEVVDAYPGQVIFHIGKSIGQCKGKLGDGFGDMITADADAVEVLHFISMKNCCTSPISLSANSVLKMQVFCAWSSLSMSACTAPVWSTRPLALICAYTSAGNTSFPLKPSRRQAVVPSRQGNR